MREITVEIKKKKLVNDGTTLVKKYETTDGKVFDKQSDAENHEKSLLIKNIHAFTHPSELLCGDFSDIFFVPKTQDELDALCYKFKVGYKYTYVSGELEIGEPFCVTFEYNGDYPDTTFISTLSYIKEQAQIIIDFKP